jgi:hypothetical protein
MYPYFAQWWGLRGHMFLRAMPAVAYQLVGSPMPDRSKGMIQTKRDTLALQVGGWEWSWRPHPIKSFNCWRTFNDCSRESNRKRGQGSSWTVAPEEEEEQVHYSSQQIQIDLDISLVTSQIGVLYASVYSGVCHTDFEFYYRCARNLRPFCWNTNWRLLNSRHKTSSGGFLYLNFLKWHCPLLFSLVI